MIIDYSLCAERENCVDFFSLYSENEKKKKKKKKKPKENPLYSIASRSHFFLSGGERSGMFFPCGYLRERG